MAKKYKTWKELRDETLSEEGKKRVDAEVEKALTIGIEVKCITCDKKRMIKPGEIPADDVPMCDTCFTPMVLVEDGE